MNGGRPPLIVVDPPKLSVREICTELEAWETWGCRQCTASTCPLLKGGKLLKPYDPKGPPKLIDFILLPILIFILLPLLIPLYLTSMGGSGKGE